MKKKQKTILKEGQVLVEVGYPGVAESKAIGVSKFVTDPATVSVNLGRTMNTGDYNSVKFGITVTLPCYSEDIKNAAKAAENIARDWMDTRAAEMAMALGVKK